jgi:hypothetical protein
MAINRTPAVHGVFTIFSQKIPLPTTSQGPPHELFRKIVYDYALPARRLPALPDPAPPARPSSTTSKPRSSRPSIVETDGDGNVTIANLSISKEGAAGTWHDHGSPKPPLRLSDEGDGLFQIGSATFPTPPLK